MKIKCFAVCAGFVLTALPALAQTDLAQVQTWQPRVVGSYEYISPEMHRLHDEIVAENDRYIVIRQDAGRACPAGLFWLADKVNLRYEDIDSGSCSEVIEVTLTSKALVFKDEGEITALYPLLSSTGQTEE